MVPPRRPPGRGWVYDPARAFRRSKALVPPDIKLEVQRRAGDLINSTLKPRHILPPPKKERFNYLVDSLKMASSFLLLLFQILFTRAQRTFCFIRIELRQTTVHWKRAI